MPRRNSNVNRSRYQVVIDSVDLSRVEETPALPPLPRKAAARRRAMRVRGW
ncbi:hypothetical protein [Streptomyces fungicidicus]|uniref:hypothetical protein n=1 Tax=Streptomyces fungicidicus TaxID=68203 RepID=UPI003319EA56